MKIINISVSKFSQPKYHYSELHDHNHHRFETTKELMDYIEKNLSPKRKYDVRLDIPEAEGHLERRIRNYFSKSFTSD